MHFFFLIILCCLIDASCAPLSTFLPESQHSNSRLDGTVGNLVSGRLTCLLCWGDKEILTESYHRAWVMRDSGASVDLFFQKSGWPFGGEMQWTRCLSIGRGDSGRGSCFCTCSFSPKVSLSWTISWAHGGWGRATGKLAGCLQRHSGMRGMGAGPRWKPGESDTQSQAGNLGWPFETS